ncbi:nuclear transport factor 2 family protein [Pedobacter cryoconitis]|uniref:nuclear transport factor 2 family protein n=1 Tax=Pedobacter cryoconitis TaxID=188932 RepID=UPI0016220909|nr:nuclear transport factor 2 family protein [Pedobacter cryoconitis]MBB5645923.1 hypothetical protein [Pedobacter cryoconitis]
MQTIEESIAQYGKAWSTKGLENIKIALKNCWTPVSTYVDTQNDMITGIDDLAAHINELHEQTPGNKLQQLSKVDHHHNSGRFSWEFTGPDGKKIPGMDFLEFNDQNQIKSIVGFFGPFTDL